jgi:hypothetical protein
VDDVAGHGKEPPGAVELTFVSVGALRDLGPTDDVKAVPRRRKLRVGVEAVYPRAGLVFADVVYISAAIWIFWVEDEAYAVKEVILP